LTLDAADDPRAVLSRPAPPPDHTGRYGPLPEQVADVRLPPAGAPPRPPVVFLHGGFWRDEFDRGHVGPLAADLALRGYPTVCLEYRRTGKPGGGWPGTFDDVLAGLAALPDLLAGAGAPVPAGSVGAGAAVLAGHSAGGQLALWAGGRVPCRGVLALAPVADLGRGYRLGLDGDAVAALLGGGPAEVPDRYAAVDPARLPPPPVPVVVVHGDRDDRVPVGIGRDYVAAARRAGGRVRLVELPGVEHFAVIDPLSAAWPAVLDALASLSGDG
jgi:acetyl esterase/lipase